MEKITKLNTEFNAYLEKLKGEWSETASKAKQFGKDDEYIKGQIKVNLAIHLQNVYNDRAKTAESFEALQTGYANFLEEEIKYWTETANKAKDFGDDENMIKEQIKIQVGNAVKQIFGVKCRMAAK